jgi:hypothetical protein
MENTENSLSVEPEKIIDFKSYKWLISSCFQKSLRRGRFDLAKPYLEFLWNHEPSYITFRFGTILAEDVGIANIPLIEEYLSTKASKKAVIEKGGLEYLLRLTEEACNSVKDRSSCDAAYISSYYGLEKHNEELNDTFLNLQNHYVDRINASWCLLGSKKFNNHNLNYSSEDDLPKYLELVAKATSEHFSTLVANAYASQIENICLGLPVVLSAYEYEKLNSNQNSKLPVGKTIENIYVKETTFFHEPTGLEIISCGIDGHTREGQNVYYQYLKRKTDFVKYLNTHNVSYEKQGNILKHCLFRLEGHEVNKRLYFPSAVQVMRECESNILNMKAGFKENILDFNELKKILIKDMPMINQMREQALKNAPVPMIDKPIPKEPKKKKKSS